MTNIRKYKGFVPHLGANVWIDKASVVIGNVTIGEGSSVWPCAVIRGDVHAIVIGQYTNIQDGSVLHVSHKSHFEPDGFALTIGNRVTVGHGVILHGAEIQDEVLLGMRCVVMDGALIESNVIIGAGSLIPPGKRITSGLWVGSPAKRVRDLNPTEVEFLGYSAMHYNRLAESHREG